MVKRRKFIKSAVTAATASMFFPGCASAKKPRRISANDKINVAFVGVGNIGSMALNGMREENGVALCDVDTSMVGKGVKMYPKARVFQDYREMLDKMGKDIDAVCVSTPDHSHFKITLDAMQCGKHVCVQKPLTHNIWQCRELERARQYYGVKTQMMNQGHATPHIRLLKEWYDSGVTGDVREVHVMCSGPKWWDGNPKRTPYFVRPKSLPMAKQPIPSTLNWDLWLNQAKYTDYNKIYAPLSWRGFWDFGTGMLGDWFCHTADAPVWILDLKDPVSVELVDVQCTHDQFTFIPDGSTVKWTFAATDKHPELVMYWYDGNREPITRPHDFDKDTKLSTSGMYMIGDKRTIHTGSRPNFDPRVSNKAFFDEFRKNRPKQSIPRVRKGSLYCEWADAIRGDIDECGSNFKYATQLTEVALLGALVQRVGGKIEWDAKNMRAKNRPELDCLIKEPERKGWESKSFGGIFG